MGWTIGVRFSPQVGKRSFFFFATTSRPTLGPTWPRFQRVPFFAQCVKQLGSEADHSPPFNAEVKNAWSYTSIPYEDVSKSFRTGRLKRELQIVQLSVTGCSCIVILWVSIMSFTAINICVASQQVFTTVVEIISFTQSGYFWIHPRTSSWRGA
jgi:hypothetical protein